MGLFDPNPYGGLLARMQSLPMPDAAPAPQGRSGPGFWRILDGLLAQRSVGDIHADYAAQQAAASEAAQRQQIVQRLSDSFSPGTAGQAGEGGVQQSGGLPTLRSLANPLVQASLAGFNVSPIVNILDKTDPLIDVANGVAYDKRATTPGARIGVNLQPVNGTLVDPNDPKNVDRYIPKIPDGADLVYDRQGRPVGVKMIDGVIQALGQTEAAQARGRKEGEAPYSFLNVPNPDGSTTLASQADVVRNLLPPGAGRSQAPADRVRDVGAAERDVNIAANRPKAEASMATLNQTTDQVLQAIDKALEQTGPASAGLGSLTGFIPGTPAKDLDAILDSIRANVGFARLDEMRANSPTGGALGSITERELALLSSVAGSLNQSQSPDQLRANLEGIRKTLGAVRQQRMEAFNRQYGGTGGGFSRAQLEAEARRRGLIN